MKINSKGTKLALGAVMLAVLFFSASAVLAIVNGDVVNNPENTGAVFLCNPSWCGMSGSLLTNDWVLSTGHGAYDQANPENNTVFPGGYQIGEPVQPDFVVTHPSLDFSLLHLPKTIVINGVSTTYRRGIYTSSTDSLANKRLNFLGYGVYDQEGHWGALHQAFVTSTGQHDEYNFVVSYRQDQSSGNGDSGAPVFTTGVAPSVTTGVLKNGQFGLPENFREWALSYIYDRPIDLPTTWFVWDSWYPKFWDSPLQNNFDNQTTWNPCPNGSYIWTANYSLETNFDYMYVIANGATTTLNGWNNSSTGSGSGPITLKVHTDVSVQSPGMTSMPIKCNSNGIRFPNPWSKPLPSYYSSSVLWDPCPGGAGFTWTALHDFLLGDLGSLTFGSSTTQLLGTATTTGYANYGPVTIAVQTASGTSQGIKSLNAKCDMATQCHGPECFSTPSLLPNNGYNYRTWNPCNGRNFNWFADYDLENNYDFVRIGNGVSTTTLTGKGTIGPISATGQLNLELATDYSVQSVGLKQLKAVCSDW